MFDVLINYLTTTSVLIVLLDVLEVTFTYDVVGLNIVVFIFSRRVVILILHVGFSQILSSPIICAVIGNVSRISSSSVLTLGRDGGLEATKATVVSCVIAISARVFSSSLFKSILRSVCWTEFGGVGGNWIRSFGSQSDRGDVNSGGGVITG